MSETPNTKPAGNEREKIRETVNTGPGDENIVSRLLDEDLSKLGFSEEEEHLLKETMMYLSEDMLAMALPLAGSPDQMLKWKEWQARLYGQQQTLLKVLAALCDAPDPESYPMLSQEFRRYLSMRKTYQEFVDATFHPQREQQLFDENLSAKLFESLRLPADTKGHWRELLAELQSKIPDPETAEKKGDERRKEFLALQHAHLLTAKQGTLRILLRAIQALQNGGEIDAEGRTVVLWAIREFLEIKRQYLYNLHNESKQSAKLAALLSMTAQEGVEEGIEHVIDSMPVLKYGSARIKLGEGMLGMKLQLAQHGIQESVLAKMFAGNSMAQRIFSESIRTLTPDGVGSLLAYMYYLYVSEDKAKAMLMYSSFLIAGKGLDGMELATSKYFGSVGKAAEKMMQMNPRLAKRALNVGKGLPVAVKFGLLMLLAWGLGDELNTALDTIERRSQPHAYDFAGNVIGAIQAPLDVPQAFGLAGANPLTEQKTYLDWQPAFAKNTVLTAATGRQRMERWDTLVEEYAREERNPLRQQLVRLESITQGPGGEQAWIRRQALDFYAGWKRLQNHETNINEQLRSLGVQTNGHLTLSQVLYQTAQNSEESAYGDRNIRAKIASSSEPYRSMYANIDAALQSVEATEKKEQLEKLKQYYSHYESLAKQLDRDRSLYVRLGIFSSAWLQERSGEHSVIPGIVDQGLYDEIRYQSERRKALSTVQDGRSLAALLEQEKPPSFTLDPEGWIGYFLVSGTTWDRRVDEERYHDGLERLAATIAMHVGKDRYERVFRPLQEAVLEQRVRGKIDARTAMSLMAQAYTEQYDGQLRASRPEEVKRGNEWTFVYGSVNPQEIAPSGMDIDPTVTNPTSAPDTPMIVHSEEFYEGDDYHGKPLCAIQTIIYFVHDKEKNDWSVVTKNYTIATTQYASKPLVGTGKLTVNAQTTTKHRESWKLWRIKHPKFAVQMHAILQAQKEQMQKREEESRATEKKEQERTISAADKQREQAKAHPGSWQPYGSERNGKYYEYVTYNPENKAFVYLRSPKLERKTYIGAVGTPTPSTDTKTGVHIELENGQQLTWDAIHGDFAKTIEANHSPAFATVLRESLSFPHQEKEAFSAEASARATLLTILATYARGETLTQREWSDLIDETVRDTARFKTPEQSRQFFARLMNEINGATLVSSRWRKGTQRQYLNANMYRRALEETRKHFER